jgi:predicted PurR-regulated permease PerM
MKKVNIKRAKWLPLALIVILGVVTYKTFDNFSQITEAISRFFRVISPLLLGILFTYFLYVPFVKLRTFFGKTKLPFIAQRKKLFSILSVFTLLILAIVIIILVVAPLIISSIVDFTRNLPRYVVDLERFLERLDDDPFWSKLNLSETIPTFFNDTINEFLNFSLVGQVTRGAISFAKGFVNVFLGIIISLYIIIDLDNINRFFKRLLAVTIKNKKSRFRLRHYLVQANKVLFTFIASKGLDSFVNMLSVMAILFLFQVPYAFLLGFIAGIFNFIPYLGSLIAVSFISVIALITCKLNIAVPVIIALLVFQQLDANFIEPRIMKNSLKISPILVIVSVIASGAYFGIAGMFLAVPFVCVVKQILLEYIEHSEAKEKTKDKD